YESTGLVGRSSLRQVDRANGQVMRAIPVDSPFFAEGLALVGDRLSQLTWQSGVAFVYDVHSFERTGQFTYRGEGWGRCYDGGWGEGVPGAHPSSATPRPEPGGEDGALVPEKRHEAGQHRGNDRVIELVPHLRDAVPVIAQLDADHGEHRRPHERAHQRVDAE